MRRFRVDGINLKILNLIDENVELQGICEALKITRFNLAGHIETLLKYKCIEKEARGRYMLTTSGLRLILKPLPFQTRQANKSTKRLHRLGLKYPLKDKLSPGMQPKELAYKIDISAKQIDLNNTDQAIIRINITARLTNKNLIVYAPQLYYQRGQPSIVIEAIAKEILDKEALMLEQKLDKFASFNLMRINTRASSQALLSEILSEEIADEGHPLAEATRYEDMPSKIVLARHPFDKKERLIIDGSKMRAKNVKELELVRAESAGEDTDIIDAQFNAILDEKLNLLDEQFRRQKADKSIRDLKKLAVADHTIIKQLLFRSQIEPQESHKQEFT